MAPGPAIQTATPRGIHKIRHVVIIMQENRSFDSYFGTYPGADGIPGLAGNPGKVPCVPDPATGRCVKPYHDRTLVNVGGPHDDCAFMGDLDNGKMDGFIKERETCMNPVDPISCEATEKDDVMGYHTAQEIPNYWRYAKHFVLQDHMFEPVGTWSLPAHLAMVSGWSAICTGGQQPVQLQEQPLSGGPGHGPRAPDRPGPPSQTARITPGPT